MPGANDGGGKSASKPAVAIASRLFIAFARDGWCQLRRLLLTFAVLFLLLGSRAIASNPQDLRFQLRSVKEIPAYHQGASILRNLLFRLNQGQVSAELLEISYSASTKDKYQRSSNSALQGIEIHIVPIDGVLDLKVLRFEHGWGGSIMGVLSSEPTTQQIDLCGSYRFEKPGHYSVAITSNEVSRIKSAEEGGGLENLTLESNWVDIDILPRDPAWAAAELNSISLGTQQCRAWGGSSCRWPPGSFGHPSFRNECFCSFICSGPTQLDPNGC